MAIPTQNSVSTLETKPIPGANAGKKSLGVISPSNDHDTAKSKHSVPLSVLLCVCVCKYTFIICLCGSLL